MAIKMMVSRDRLGEEGTYELNNYPGAEKGLVYHHYECPHRNKTDMSGSVSPDCDRRCSVHEGLVMKVSHEGRVLSTGEHNGYHDSDFYAMVWDEAKGQPVEVTYASTRGWTYPNNAVVDATPEIRAKAVAWYEKREQARREAERAAERATPRVGKRLVVVKGRKVPKGVSGECFWMGRDKFSRTGGSRVGIRTDEGDVFWTSADNVMVVVQG